jgi:type IV pilus assembly protein PilV
MHLNKRHRSEARQQGFTVLETMVALIVICVGLLGIAKMQALALNTSNTSRQRALAAIEAASLAAAMHSNRAYWATATTPTTTSVTVYPTQAVTSTDGTLQTEANNDLPGGASSLKDCVGTVSGVAVCSSPVRLAAYDMANWTHDLAGLLPNPSASVTCTVLLTTVPSSCIISISWTETAVSMTQQEATQQAASGGSSLFQKPYYYLYVEP